MLPETAIYDFIKAAVLAAPGTSALSGCAIHETRYEPIESEKGIRIGDSTSSQFGPRGAIWKEFNCQIALEIFTRVDDGNKAAARTTARAIAIAVAQKIQEDSDLSSRVCDVRVGSGARGWARVASTPYAVHVLNLLVDPFG